jgi:hypothetical protein
VIWPLSARLAALVSLRRKNKHEKTVRILGISPRALRYELPQYWIADEDTLLR